MEKPPATPERLVVFGPFTLDAPRGQLRRDAAVVPLRRKAWEVLCHLAARRGEVVSNQELLDAVWPGVHVTPQTLTNVIHELRIALDDTVRAPRFIRTVHRQGHVLLDDADSAPAAGKASAREHRRTGLVVGRDGEMARLRALWGEVLAGESRLAFVTGEPGIGKTTLVEAAIDALTAAGAAREAAVAIGSCVEHHGQDEAYVPLLDALEELLEGP